MKKLAAALLMLCLLLLTGAACADDGNAADIAAQCRITVSSQAKTAASMLNRSYRSYWTGRAGDTIHVEVPAGQQAQGIYIAFYGDAVTLTVQSGDAQLAVYDKRYFSDYIPFSHPAEKFDIELPADCGAVSICRLCVLSAGTLPDWVQCWQELPDGEADLLLVATHPDDETLWFGGMVPTYGRELGKKIMVICMTGNSRQRRLELLAALWTAGLTYYPTIGTFPDRNGRTVWVCRDRWGETEPEAFITEAIRRYHPRVVVTQDIRGEYGNPHHKVTVDAVINAVTKYCADQDFASESAEKYGVWQPVKLYLHLWQKDQIMFDWSVPLASFGGETGISIARRAFRQHVSQQRTKYSVQDYGPYDCRLFGLYWSAVGDDDLHNDLFEHVTETNSDTFEWLTPA